MNSGFSQAQAGCTYTAMSCLTGLHSPEVSKILLSSFVILTDLLSAGCPERSWPIGGFDDRLVPRDFQNLQKTMEDSNSTRINRRFGFDCKIELNLICQARKVISSEIRDGGCVEFHQSYFDRSD